MSLHKKRNKETVALYCPSKKFIRTLRRNLGPKCSPNAINKFEPIQKRAVKWILAEGKEKYSEQEYHSKLHKLELLPLLYFFAVKKLKLFHNIVNPFITDVSYMNIIVFSSHLS